MNYLKSTATTSPVGFILFQDLQGLLFHSLGYHCSAFTAPCCPNALFCLKAAWKKHRKWPTAAISIPRHGWPVLLPWQVTRTRGERPWNHLTRKLLERREHTLRSSPHPLPVDGKGKNIEFLKITSLFGLYHYKCRHFNANSHIKRLMFLLYPNLSWNILLQKEQIKETSQENAGVSVSFYLQRQI